MIDRVEEIRIALNEALKLPIGSDLFKKALDKALEELAALDSYNAHLKQLKQERLAAKEQKEINDAKRKIHTEAIEAEIVKLRKLLETLKFPKFKFCGAEDYFIVDYLQAGEKIIKVTIFTSEPVGESQVTELARNYGIGFISVNVHRGDGEKFYEQQLIRNPKGHELTWLITLPKLVEKK